jgi:amino acid transporter
MSATGTKTNVFVENFGILIIGAMLLVACSVIAIAWFVSENARDYIKDDKKDVVGVTTENTITFDRVINILTAMGVALLTATLMMSFFLGSQGINDLGNSGNFSIYVLVCALLGIAFIVLDSILLSVIDPDKTNADGEKTQAVLAVQISLGLAVVCTVVGVAGYFADDIVNAMSTPTKSADDAEFGFDFEF